MIGALLFVVLLSVPALCQATDKLWRDDGRCGASYPLSNGGPTQCNPDNPNGFVCCSRWWCGNTPAHCQCTGCIDYSNAPAPSPSEVYVELENGPGCGKASITTAEECGEAAGRLGYPVLVTSVSNINAPLGCFTGHPVDQWSHTFFNTQDGATGNANYRSICKKDIKAYTCPSGTTGGRSGATLSGEINTGDVCDRPSYVANAEIYPENVNRIGLHDIFTVECRDGFSLPVQGQYRNNNNELVTVYMSPVMRCQANGVLTNENMICVDCDVSDWLSKQKFSGVAKALVGYNLRTGDPMADVDVGMKNRIFEAQDKSSSGCYIDRYDPAITVNEEKTCSSQVRSEISKSFKELREDVETDTSNGGGIQVGIDLDIALEASLPVGEGGSAGGKVSGTIPPPFKNSWSESDNMKRAQRFFSSSKGSLVTSEAECSLWVFQLTHQTKLPMFTQGFKRALQMLNDANHKSCDEQQIAFRRFIEDYGTHFFVYMIFGAKYSTVYKYSETATSMFNEGQLKGCSDKSMAIQLGVVAGMNEYSKSCSNQSHSELNGLSNGKGEFIKITKGSGPVKDIEEWATVELIPVPTHFRLSAMPNLLANRHIENQAGINIDGPTLRKWFVPMYYNYCEAMGKDCTGNCDIAFCAKCSEDDSVCKKCENGATGDGTTTCTRKVCPRPEITGAILTPSEVEYVEGDVVAISCPTGHDLHGAERLRCNSNLQWDGGVSECEPRFQCMSPKKLIPRSTVCDGNNDCGDCTDELEDGCKKTCEKALFNAEELRCHNGEHIYIGTNLNALCDGYNSCGDCTDELINYTLGPKSCKLSCTPSLRYSQGNLGIDGYCYQCEWGEGDCDDDDECLGNLKCGDNNCAGMTGVHRFLFDGTDDCCTGTK